MHNHDIAREDWPFEDQVNTHALTTVGVLEKNLPILLVTHEMDDGSWQFLCRTTNEPSSGRLICLGCALEKDSSLAQIADLPRGWIAWRDSVGEPWQREPRPSDWDE